MGKEGMRRIENRVHYTVGDAHAAINMALPTLLPISSSVARGGGGGGSSPPHWLVKDAKSHVFCAFEADFL